MRILVTNATRNSGLATIRGLAGNGHIIVGADERKLPFDIHSRHTTPYYIHPEYEDEYFINTLIEIIQKEKIDVVLPVGGYEQVSAYKKRLKKYTYMLVPDYKSYAVADDNKTTLEECKKLNIECPNILSEKEAIAMLEKNVNKTVPIKVVVKPRKNVGGAEGLYYVDSPALLKKIITESEKIYKELIIQEYIPGKERMKTVNLLFDNKTRLAAYFTSNKMRQWPTTGGLTAMSISTNEWELVEMVLPFFQKLQWQGLAEVELKVDSRDENPKLIEINPRFWGYIGFPIRCGVNFPLLACELAMNTSNKKRESPSYPTGVKYLNPSLYTKALLSEFRTSTQKKKVLKRVFSELKGKKVSNNFEIQDCKVNIAKLLLQLLQKK